jgi:hypothetical protein
LNDHEQERFEAELSRAQPARLPEEFKARLLAARPGIEAAQRTRVQPASGWLGWWRVWCWAAPATALVVVGLFIIHAKLYPGSVASQKPLAVSAGLKADAVQVDHDLVRSFDVVATLPNGLPVRFRCRQWKDQLLVTDKSSGVEIEQNTPLVEVVPVRFETY